MTSTNEEKFTFTKDESDPLKDKYGVSPFIQSQFDPSHRFQVKFQKICEINQSLDGQQVKLRWKNFKTNDKLCKFITFRINC